MLGPPAPGRRLEQLPPDPGGGWAGGHVPGHQGPPVVGDEQQDEQGLEGQGLDGEEIGRPDRAGVVRRGGIPFSAHPSEFLPARERSKKKKRLLILLIKIHKEI